MNDHDIEKAVQWFRQGLRDRLGDVGQCEFPANAPWSVNGAYEAGMLLGEQMLCENDGHDDRVCPFHDVNGGTNRCVHYEDRRCRKCGRIKRVVIASFDNHADWNEYSKKLARERLTKEIE